LIIPSDGTILLQKSTNFWILIQIEIKWLIIANCWLILARKWLKNKPIFQPNCWNIPQNGVLAISNLSHLEVCGSVSFH
jgi:hypothetical protein